MTKRFAIGVDIGGSHISSALVNMFEGNMVKNSLTEKKINNKASAEEILNGWSEALIETITKVGKEQIAGIGFAMPGPFVYDQGIALFDESVDKFENLYGIRVAFELSKRLNLNIPIRFMNDASAFAAGEAWLGQASNVSKSVSVTLGTGFGSAFLINDIPVVEGDGVPKMGCLWHLPFKDSIGDDYFSTRWFVKRWKEISGKTVNGAKEIAYLAERDRNAISLFFEYGRNMGYFLGSWLTKFEADVLIIGGNISGAYSLFGSSLESILKQFGFTGKIAISKLKEDAAIIGSARIIDPEYYESIKPVLSKM
ncbi:MAG: ROK family protein [Marinilabiliaceae bacterium]|nr:ROK family protein [Marinilabiliaceae bacterium]